MRVLYYVPILHTAEELGTMGPLFQTVEEEVLGRQQTIAKRAQKQEYLNLVAERVLNGPFDCEKLLVYLDGLPAQKEIATLIYQNLVRKGLPLYSIIEKLVAKGAKIIGTESPQLLY